MLERDYKRFRSFNKVYWIIAAIIAIITFIASMTLVTLAAIGYSDAEANSELAVVVFIFVALLGAVLALIAIMLIALLTSLPYVIFNGIHLYKFHKANIRFDTHMTFALVMSIIMGYFDITTILSLSTNLLSAMLNLSAS